MGIRVRDDAGPDELAVGEAMEGAVDDGVLAPRLHWWPMAAEDRGVGPGPAPKAAGSGLDAERIRGVLAAVLTHVAPLAPGVEYRVVGTAAAALCGVRLPVGDIDLLFRRRPDVDRFGEALASLAGVECLFAPAALPEARQYFARYAVGGTAGAVTVELSTVEVETESDTRECVGRGPWERYTRVECGGHSVPVVALELRLLTELSRNRPERYGPIAERLSAGQCDRDLLRRGLERAGGWAPDDPRRRLLERLEITLPAAALGQKLG